MRLPLLLSLAATALAEFLFKEAPGGVKPGCSSTVSGTFDIIRLSPGSLKKRDEPYPYPGQQVRLRQLTLKDSVLRDSEGRIGSVVANFQFQFDGPEPQDQAIYTRGFSLCKNHTIALGQTTYFEECDAGAGFWNYYFFVGLDTRAGRPTKCRPVNLVAPPPGGFGGATTVNSIVIVTETMDPASGYGTATGTGVFGTATGAATGAATGTAKGTGKDATGRGTATGTGAGALETGKDAKGARPGISSNSTASLTALTPNLPTTSASNSTTTSSSEKTPPPPPATPTNSAPTGKSTNAAAGFLAGGKGHSAALLVGLMGVALL